MEASDEREELVLTRQSSIRTAPVADILSLRQPQSTHGKGPLKLLVFWKLKLLEDLHSPSLSDIPTAVILGPPLHRIPFQPITKPRYVVSVWQNSHFLGFRCSPASERY